MKKFLLILLCSLIMLPATAAVGDEFTYKYDGQTLNYTILDEEAKTVKVKAGYAKNPGTGNATDDDYIPGNTVEGVLVIPDKVTNNDVEYTVTSIGERAFYMNSGLTSVTIPASVTTIEFSSFFRCESLTSVMIPNSVTTIGASAFSTCTSLEEVTIPESVTLIDSFAFVHCTGLKTFTSLCVVAPKANSPFSSSNDFTSDSDRIYDNVSLIVPQAGVDSYIYSEEDWSRFVNLSTLEGKKYNIITETNGLRYRVVSDDSAVLITGAYTDLTEVTIPETLEEDGHSYSVTSISSDVFQECNKLTSVTIPNSVTSIGSYAFVGCEALESVTIPESVTYLGGCSFMRCANLKSVTSLGSITSIGNNTFARCYDLTSVTIPNTVTTIGGSAFALCGSLKSVEIPASVTSIATVAFSDCTGLESVTFLGSATNIETAAFKGSINLTNIILKSVNPPSLEYGAFSSPEPYEYLYLYGKATVTVPDGCLGNYLSSDWASFSKIKTESGDTPGKTFTNNGLQYQVVGANSVMLVGVTDSGLKTVTIPGEVEEEGTTYSVTTIGKEAFSGSNITSAVLPGSLIYIAESALCECSLSSVTIPGSVTSIGNYAFSGCSSLLSVTIPASVTYIGTDVFEHCKGLRLLDMSETTLSDFSGVAGELSENTLIFVKAGTSIPEGRANVVVGDMCENFVINYGETTNNQLLLSVPHAFTAENVTINRSFTEGEPATLYLPFELEAANYGTFYTGGAYSAADQMVYFSEVKDTFTAPNTPYMFIPNQNFNSGITLSNMAVSITPEDEENDGLNGIYEKKEITEEEVAKRVYYGWANEGFCWADTGAKIDACRAYYKLPDIFASNAPAMLKATFDEIGTTGINNIDREENEQDAPVYNLNGQRVGPDYRGVVIKNGEKIINPSH